MDLIERKIQIRPFRRTDAEDCREIWNAVVRDGRAFPQTEELQEGETAGFFEGQYTAVAEAEGKVVGLYILHPNNVGRVGHIANASYAVSGALRGRHIGEQLVRDCLRKAGEMGYRILQFNAVVASNVHALHLYLRLGFTDLGIIPGGFRNIDDVYEDIHIMYHRVGRFTFRTIHPDETEQAVALEQICFPPNEACAPENMRSRIRAASDAFLVAVDQNTGKIVGALNGLVTDESVFRDAFFTDAALHNPKGKNVLLTGLEVLSEYRGLGLAEALVSEYKKMAQKAGREALLLTCLSEKVAMYKKFGFTDMGISKSEWGGETWHEMRIVL